MRRRLDSQRCAAHHALPRLAPSGHAKHAKPSPLLALTRPLSHVRLFPFSFRHQLPLADFISHYILNTPYCCWLPATPRATLHVKHSTYHVPIDSIYSTSCSSVNGLGAATKDKYRQSHGTKMTSRPSTTFRASDDYH